MLKRKFPDLTTSGQKMFALAIIVLILGVLYVITPPLVVLFKNLWLLAILGIPMLFLVMNYQILWEYMKKLSWDMTKKIISSDPLWHMYRYYDYLVDKTEKLEKSIREVSTIRRVNADKVVELQGRLEAYSKQLQYIKKEDLQYKITSSKVASTQKSIDRIVPIIDTIDKQLAQLKQVLQFWKADNQVLKVELDNKKQEYEMLRELSGATETASAWLGDNSEEIKQFKESLNQMEKSIATYTVNIETFDEKVLPKLTEANSNLMVSAEEGEKIIERLKQQRLHI